MRRRVLWFSCWGLCELFPAEVSHVRVWTFCVCCCTGVVPLHSWFYLLDLLLPGQGPSAATLPALGFLLAPSGWQEGGPAGSLQAAALCSASFLLPRGTSFPPCVLEPSCLCPLLGSTFLAVAPALRSLWAQAPIGPVWGRAGLALVAWRAEGRAGGQGWLLGEEFTSEGSTVVGSTFAPSPPQPGGLHKRRRVGAGAGSATVSTSRVSRSCPSGPCLSVLLSPPPQAGLSQGILGGQRQNRKVISPTCVLTGTPQAPPWAVAPNLLHTLTPDSPRLLGFPWLFWGSCPQVPLLPGGRHWLPCIPVP